jgi:DMSO/TMAO reductase YedYZ molybdopterin-dependent catalytic subunit
MLKGSTKHDVVNAAYSSAGLIIRQKEPRSLEAPFDRIDSYVTPTELFYIRSHFPTPRLDRASYQLRVDGAFGRPLVLSYDELRSMPSETRVATLECAGNGRVFLVPQASGAQWELGAVGNAEWTGVPLRTLLERADLAADACEIVLEGADRKHRWRPDMGPRRIPGPCATACVATPGSSIGLRRKFRTLLARAKDAVGMLQPDEHDQNYGGYVVNHSLPIEVLVDDTDDPLA